MICGSMRNDLRKAFLECKHGSRSSSQTGRGQQANRPPCSPCGISTVLFSGMKDERHAKLYGPFNHSGTCSVQEIDLDCDYRGVPS
jgi:hypothetical protein